MQHEKIYIKMERPLNFVAQ